MPLHAYSLRRLRRRDWRYWLVRLALVPVLFGVGLLVFVRVSQFRAAVAWAEALAEADRLDPGWRWGDLEAKRANVPDEQNAALLILQLSSRWPYFGQVRGGPVAAPTRSYPA